MNYRPDNGRRIKNIRINTGRADVLNGDAFGRLDGESPAIKRGRKFRHSAAFRFAVGQDLGFACLVCAALKLSSSQSIYRHVWPENVFSRILRIPLGSNEVGTTSRRNPAVVIVLTGEQGVLSLFVVVIPISTVVWRELPYCEFLLLTGAAAFGI